MCPVTGREFLKKDMDAYNDKWNRACKSFGENMANATLIEHNFEQNGEIIKLPDSDKTIFIEMEHFMTSNFDETVESVIKYINEKQG